MDRERLGWVCHYIHLNPVRAKLCEATRLKDFRWSSLWYLHQPRDRPGFLQLDTCLAGAGDLRDDKIGREKYASYLQWLAEDRPAQKAMEFGAMSSAWVLGSPEFKREMVAAASEPAAVVRLSQAEAREAQQLAWQNRLERCMKVLGKKAKDISGDAKSADWKVGVAAFMKRNGLCTNRWLAERLNMGVEFSVSRYVSEAEAGDRAEAARMTEELNAKVKH